MLATDFLRDSSLSPEVPAAKLRGKRVLVLGGGNVAIDSAMSALRLGASWVGMTCLEPREKMPAHAWELQEALDESIEVFPARTFKEVTQLDGRVTGVRTAHINFRGFIEGRPDFDELPGTGKCFRPRCHLRDWPTAAFRLLTRAQAARRSGSGRSRDAGHRRAGCVRRW
jgi:NADPH-dependent glutamate synthase beta subunit-like oxidoreductase